MFVNLFFQTTINYSIIIVLLQYCFEKYFDCIIMSTHPIYFIAKQFISQTVYSLDNLPVLIKTFLYDDF